MAYAKRIALAIGGLIGFGAGLFLSIQANIGIAPWDVLNMGIRARTGLLYGNVSIIVGICVVLIDLLLKEKIGLGTVFDVLLVGKTVDFLQWLDFLPLQQNFWTGLALLLVGMPVMGISVAVYMREGLGCGPRDAMMMALGKRLKRLPVGIVRNLMDLAALLVGFLLGGGPVGAGTLILVLGMGPAMQMGFALLRYDPTTVQHESLLQTAFTAAQAWRSR